LAVILQIYQRLLAALRRKRNDQMFSPESYQTISSCLGRESIVTYHTVDHLLDNLSIDVPFAEGDLNTIITGDHFAIPLKNFS
jgi:hypothetical protein